MSGGSPERQPGSLPLSPRRRCTLRGRMQNVIVVKPRSSMFSQAVFILKEDYFLRSDISRAELLRQAKEAAADYTGEKLEKAPPTWLPLSLLLLSLSLIVSALIYIFL